MSIPAFVVVATCKIFVCGKAGVGQSPKRSDILLVYGRGERESGRCVPALWDEVFRISETNGRAQPENCLSQVRPGPQSFGHPPIAVPKSGGLVLNGCSPFARLSKSPPLPSRWKFSYAEKKELVGFVSQFLHFSSASHFAWLCRI